MLVEMESPNPNFWRNFFFNVCLCFSWLIDLVETYFRKAIRNLIPHGPVLIFGGGGVEKSYGNAISLFQFFIRAAEAHNTYN